MVSESEIFDKFKEIVASSLRVEPDRVTWGSHLDTDLGAESLDLIEITMEAESAFNIWISEKNILDIATETFGEGVLQKDGVLTEAGKQLLRRRLPEADAGLFEGEVTVKDLQRYFLRVGTWVQMISNLANASPRECAKCGGNLVPATGLRMKCVDCAEEVALPSGEELNAKWVQDYYRNEYLPSLNQLAGERSATSV